MSEESCFVQSCEQIITGRYLYYNRIIEILQNEEYLREANLEHFYEQDGKIFQHRSSNNNAIDPESNQFSTNVQEEILHDPQQFHEKKLNTKYIYHRSPPQNSFPRWSNRWKRNTSTKKSKNLRNKRSIFDIIETTINRLTYDPNNLVEEKVEPRPGLFYAGMLMLLVVPFIYMNPIPEILPGQAPPRSPQPGLSFDGGASPNDIDRMSPDMGEALALVPIGHEPVAVFPPFSVHRRVPAIGVIFSEKKSQKFKRRNGRKSSSFMEKVMPSEFSSRLWNFLGNVGTNVLCMRPRVQRYLFSSRSEDHDLASTDCFREEEEPLYGFRVKVMMKRDEPCNLKNCLSHLNFPPNFRTTDRSSYVEFQADYSPECKVKNVCG